MTARANDEAWGVLHCKPLKERSVARQLAERGVESYLPLYRKRAPRKDRPPVLAPLFPCYLFVNIAARDHGYRATWTPGVLRLLGVENRPHVVPPDIIATLRAHERGKGYIVLRHRFQPEQKLRITRGLLQGFEGVFHKETSDGERVRILLSHLGFQAMVDVAVEDLEPVAIPAPRHRRVR